MIAALLTVAMARPAVVVVPDLDADSVTVQALVKLPKMGDAERICALAAWDSILDGTEEYTGATLRNYGQQTGRAVLAATLGDHFYLRFSMPKNQLGSGIAMAESLLRRPLLLDESLNRSLRKRMEGAREPWAAALDPEAWREAKPNRTEILATFRKLVRPENVVLAIGGDVTPAAVSQELARLDDWAPPTPRSFVREWASAARPLMKAPGSVMTFELCGPENADGLASLPRDLLVAVAMGVGKGSALQMASRERHGWSYRQEGFLQPTPSGVRLRLILAKRASDDPTAFLTQLREALQAEVKGWTEADRSRTVGLLRSWLEDGIGVAPIRLLPEGRAVASLEERTHLRAWWRMKFGTELNEGDLIRQVEAVKLDELKVAAMEMLEKAGGRFLISSG